MIMRKITEIILHCAATREGQDVKAAAIDKYHKSKGWKCIGYNWYIDLDGTVEKGRSEEISGAHTIGHNANSIGICYCGGCDKNGKAKDTRTEAQREAMYELVYKKLYEYGLSLDDVYCHNQFDNKACPSFKIDQFKEEYDAWLQRKLKMSLKEIARVVKEWKSKYDK